MAWPLQAHDANNIAFSCSFILYRMVLRIFFSDLAVGLVGLRPKWLTIIKATTLHIQLHQNRSTVIVMMSMNCLVKVRSPATIAA